MRLDLIGIGGIGLSIWAGVHYGLPVWVVVLMVLAHVFGFYVRTD